MDRAHIRSGKLIRVYNGEKGWLQLSDGSKTSPITIGFAKGRDKVVPAADDVQDTSTGTDTVKVRGDWKVQGGRVRRVTTIRDTKAAEIAARRQQRRAGAQKMVRDDKVFKAFLLMMKDLANGTAPKNPNMANMMTWFSSNLED